MLGKAMMSLVISRDCDVTYEKQECKIKATKKWLI